jgi:O-antigen/teichoic acid export membrane protein
MKDLKERTIRGGLARLCAQVASFIFRLGSLVVLARLLGPQEFGLVGMVTAFTGVLYLFRDFGLSSAVIQQTNVTQDQKSTLFWINILVGALLALGTAGMAPAVAAFYHEPRLVGVTVALATGFLFNAAGVQHGALLQREMRFTALAVINTLGLAVGAVVAIVGAKIGWGYWALVVMTVTLPLINTVGVWLVTRWMPGMPHRRSGVGAMVHFGGTVTLNGMIAYVATNFEKVLLGRFWGVDALGIYGRAYQIINIPTENLNSAAGEVAFAALSRLQDDPARLKRYFLKGYSLILVLTIPVTVACALFAKDTVLVLLGPKWISAEPVFRFLAPTILVFAIVNPLGWLLYAMGLVKRSVKMGLVIAPIMIGSYLIGLPYGPKGVALAYSIVMCLWIFPAILWCVHGTVFSAMDIWRTATRPLIASIVSAGVAWGVRLLYVQSLSPVPRLFLECAVLLITFIGMLMFGTGEKSFYLELLRALRQSPSKEKSLASV